MQDYLARFLEWMDGRGIVLTESAESLALDIAEWVNQDPCPIHFLSSDNDCPVCRDYAASRA